VIERDKNPQEVCVYNVPKCRYSIMNFADQPIENIYNLFLNQANCAALWNHFRNRT